MPITLGPQASCSLALPALRQEHRPDDQPEPHQQLRRGPRPGRAEANKAVRAAQRLGIVRGSTLFYDLEAFDTRRSTACTSRRSGSCSAWTTSCTARLRVGLLLQRRVRHPDARRRAGQRPNNPYTLPDQIWIADWDGKANTSSSYIRSDGWQPYSRVKQYRGGHNETWGGVTINIDRNYLNLRTPKLPGEPAPAPAPAAPRYTRQLHRRTRGARRRRSAGRATARPTPRRTGHDRAAAVPAQAAARLPVRGRPGRGTPQTLAALHAFQTRVRPVRCAPT